MSLANSSPWYLLKNKFQFSPQTWWCSRTPEPRERVLLWSSSITKTSGVITYCWFSHNLSLLPYFKRLGPVGTRQLNLVLWGLVVAIVNDAHKHSANCWELAWGKCFLFLVLFFVTMLWVCMILSFWRQGLSSSYVERRWFCSDRMRKRPLLLAL